MNSLYNGGNNALNPDTIQKSPYIPYTSIEWVNTGIVFHQDTDSSSSLFNAFNTCITHFCVRSRITNDWFPAYITNNGSLSALDKDSTVHVFLVEAQKVHTVRNVPSNALLTLDTKLLGGSGTYVAVLQTATGQARQKFVVQK